MADLPLTSATCPECDTQLVTFDNAQLCPRCESGLDQFDPDRHDRPFGWSWLDRWAFRTAYRWNARQFAALAGRDPGSARSGAARWVLMVLAVVFFAIWLGILAAGVWLVVIDFPSLKAIAGLLLVLVGLAIRPRFGKVDPLLERLTREQAPTLFALIDRVADAVGSPRPQVVGFDRSLDAYAGTVGLRRRRVLTLGLPLWLVLGPQPRVALLAHELGHFRNGDVRSGLVTQPALLTFDVLATVTRPDPDVLEKTEGLLAWLGLLVGHAAMAVVSNLLLSIQLVLELLAYRDGQRGEYLADDWAVAVAGSRAEREHRDTWVALEPIAMMMARAARSSAEVANWRAAAAESRQRLAPELPVRHQHSISLETSLFAQHPPTGLRRRMVDARPPRDPKVVLTETESERIDAELAPLYARARRAIGALDQDG